MEKNNFIVENPKGRSFVCNSDTGRWALVADPADDTLDSLREEYAPPNFIGTHMFVLNITRECNMGCVYCFAKEIKGTEKMSSEVGRRAIDRILQLPIENRTIVFHGNEPLTNFELIKDLVQYTKDRGEICFRMQSNGTLFTDEKIDYCTKNNIDHGKSLMGFIIVINPSLSTSNKSIK